MFYVSYVIPCCIYVAGLTEAGCFATSRLSVGNLLPEFGVVQGLWVHVFCYVYDCSVFVILEGLGLQLGRQSVAGWGPFVTVFWL